MGTGQTECICVMTGQYLTLGIVKIMCKPMITFPGGLNQEIYVHVNTSLTFYIVAFLLRFDPRLRISMDELILQINV